MKRMTSSIAWLILALLAVALLLSQLRTEPQNMSSREPAEHYPMLSLSLLVMQAEQQHGRLLATTGVVRGFNEPEHYWIEDAQLNRVALQPLEKARPWLGEHVRVSGRFLYHQQQGRRLELLTIEAAP